MAKIREPEKLRTKYESRKKSVLEFAGKAGDDQRERINRLRVEHNELLPEASVEREIENIARSTDQSKYDASIPDEMLQPSASEV